MCLYWVFAETIDAFTFIFYGLKLKSKKHMKKLFILVALMQLSFLLFSQTCGSIQNDQIKGHAFYDWNYNGVKDANDSRGVEGIMVEIYDCDDNLLTTQTTDADGNFSYAGLNPLDTFRVAYKLTAERSFLKSSALGADNGSFVQFVQPGNCAPLGVGSPMDYSTGNPLVATSMMIAGNQSAATRAILGMPSDFSQPAVHIETSDAVGAVWGLAYQRSSQTIFSSAFLKRHVGFGADGMDAIYMLDYSNPTGTGAATSIGTINLSTLGVNVGTNPRVDPLPASPAAPSLDLETFDMIGKVGIGDIEVSSDENTLYVMNLNNGGELVLLDISDLSNVTLINRYAVPDPACSNAEYQAFAIEVSSAGEVYIGVTCTAETSGNTADLHAYVYRFNGSGFDASPVYDRALNYDRGCAHYQTAVNFCSAQAEWRPWASNWGDVSGSFIYYHPSPLLTDIEFLLDGDIVLGISDRFAHQASAQNYRGEAGSTSVIGGVWAVGDILRACRTGATYTDEGQAGCGDNVEPYDRTSEGNGAPTEFYEDHVNLNAPFNNEAHSETHMGSLAYNAASNTMIGAFWDPTGNVNTGGLRSLDNTTGDRVNAIQLYSQSDDGSARKGAGLGDIEMLGGLAPLEIGNFVWEDTNGNGEQDACEQGLAGVTVELYDDSNNFLSSAVTDANGHYVFSNNATANSTTSHIYQLATLLHGQDYELRFPTMVNALHLTRQFAATSSVPLNSDADDNAVVTVMASDIPIAGANNHTFDVGYTSVMPCNLTSAGLTNAQCNDNATGGTAADDHITFTLNPVGANMGATYTVSVNNGFTVSPATASYGTATSFTLSAGSANGVMHTLTITDAMDANCTIDVDLMATPCSTCPTNNCRSVTVQRN